MTDPIATLRTLHRIHRQLSDLRERQARGPKQIKAREVNVARLEAELNQVQEDAKRARMAVDQKELQLKSSEAKIDDLKVKLNACKSNREYQALKEQIAADEMAGSVLADEILEAMEKTDEFKTHIADAKSKFEQSKADLEQTRQKVAEQEDRLIADITRLEAELAETEKEMPADLRGTYDRVVRSKGSDAMAPVEGECCGGCYQQIPPNIYNGLTLGKIAFCGSCGRLLYLPEDRRVGSSG